MTDGGRACIETESTSFLPSTTSGCNSSSIPYRSCFKVRIKLCKDTYDLDKVRSP